jgi:hypothetical protein
LFERGGQHRSSSPEVMVSAFERTSIVPHS